MTNKLKNFFINSPKYNSDKDYEAYSSITLSLNLLFMVNAVLHSVYLIGFSVLEIDWLTIVEIIDVTLYAAGVIFIKYIKWSWVPCLIYTILETFVHQIMCLFLLGEKTGFEFLIIPIIIITMFISAKNRILVYLRDAVVILACFVFIFFSIILRDYTPTYFHLPESFMLAIFILNCLASFLIMGLFAHKIFLSMEKLRMSLNSKVDQKDDQIDKLQSKIIISFADIIEARDGSTGQHVKRTSEYVEAILYELRREEDFDDFLTSEYMHNIILSAPLHDIGKITIPDSILKKPGRLTDEEFEIIKKHTVNGKMLLEKSMSDLENAEFLTIAKGVAACHHECWDGSGYPYGLRGSEIPFAARVMTIADFFDAIVTKRCYKEAMSFDEAFELIKQQRGKKFDPVITDAFLAIRKQIEVIARNNR